MIGKIIIVLFLAAIGYTLGSSFYFLVRDKGAGERVVDRLSWRVGLSLLLFGLFVLALKLGWIEAHGLLPRHGG